MSDITLGDLCIEVIDCEHKTAPEDPLGQFWSIGTPAMAGNKIDYGQAKRISEATYNAWTRRGRPSPNDIILAREAPVGPVVRVPDSARVALGQRTVLLRPNPERVDPAFLYYALVGDEMQARMHSRAEGSTVAHLNVAEVRELRFIGLPPIAEQRAIAGVLGALDDKIESNRRIAEAAGTLARMEFARLVVDARPGRLGEVAELKYGKALAEGVRRPGPVAVFGSSGVTGWHDAAAVPGPVVVLGRKGRPGTTYLSFDDCWPIDTTFWLAPKQPVSLAWLYLAVERMDLGRFGADSAVPGLNREMAEADELAVPDTTTMEAIQDLAWPLLTQVDRCGRESARLGALRDALLPELLSGRLRVRDVEDGHEGVA